MSGRLCREWQQKAEEDYQAAEKYLKAFLSLKGGHFPKTHDLILLKNLCLKQETDFEFVSDLVISLNPYSVEFRYPGEQATKRDAKTALAAIKEIREFIRVKLNPADKSA